MKLHFYGGAKTVTGANYLLEAQGKKILVDCGLFQGSPEQEARNYEPFPYNPETIDFVLITHAHLDHIGRLPKLLKDGFRGKIFATGPTIDFARLMLEDTERVLEEKANKADLIPLFLHSEVEETMEHFHRVEYEDVFKIAKGIEVCFRDAGHVLGSAIIELKVKVGSGTKKIVFSGDLGNDPVPFLRTPATISDVDYLLVESAYGDRRHESPEHCQRLIENAVEEIAAKKGVLIIPSFALERTQQILYHLNNLIERHKIPQMPIFLDSPLAIKITQVYERYPQYYDAEASFLVKEGDDAFKFPGLEMTLTTAQSKKINRVPPPKIIIAGSGMSQGGRVVHHESFYLSGPNNILLIVAYQAKGTLGRRIADGAKEVEILDQKIPVRAKIEQIAAYSGHADSEQLFKWVSRTRYSLKKVFVVQGEEKPAEALAQRIKDDLGVEAMVPEAGQTVEL